MLVGNKTDLADKRWFGGAEDLLAGFLKAKYKKAPILVKRVGYNAGSQKHPTTIQ